MIFNRETTFIYNDQRIKLGHSLNLVKDLVQPLQKGKLILFLFEPTPHLISVYAHCVENNIASLLLDSRIGKEELINIIQIYSPNYIITTKKNFSFKGYEIIKQQKEIFLFYIQNLDTKEKFINRKLSILLSTSGSTGSPKLIRLSKENVLCNAKSIIQYLEITENDTTITNLPLSYSFGLSILNTYMLAGATLILTELSVVEKGFWDIFMKEKITSFSGVPYTYEMLKKLKFLKRNLPNLKTLTQAGGKLNKNIKQEFFEWSRNLGIKFFTMYGQTEATARISFLDPKDFEKYPDSIGKSIPGGNLSIIDESGKRIESANIEGEIVYAGKNIMMGYAETREDLSKGPEITKLLTGDLGYFNEDGYFYITGRKKRILKVYGNRYNLDEIQNRILQNDIECAVGGVDDKICIYILKKEDEEVVGKILNSMKITFRAYEISIINKIPYSNNGKIFYKQLPPIQ